MQADLSIRGTTFEQSLILVNGLRVNDPETGHLNLDIPVPLDAVTRIDILHGSGSTFYGSDAIGGAVNLLTGEPGTGLTVTARSGRRELLHGSLEQHLRTGYSARTYSPSRSPPAATPPTASSPTATTPATPSPARAG